MNHLLLSTSPDRIYQLLAYPPYVLHTQPCIAVAFIGVLYHHTDRAEFGDDVDVGGGFVEFVEAEGVVQPS